MNLRTPALALAAFVVMSDGAVAEGNRLQSDFTFRRIGVPQSNATRRITVQVAPQPPGGPSAPPKAGSGGVAGQRGDASPAVAGATGGLSSHAWFWDAVSPDLAESKPGRLQLALRTLANAPQGETVTAPRLQALQQIASAHGRDILGATVGTKVSPALVLAVIAVESAGQEDARSRAGAEGLMQLMPPTAARFGVNDSLDGTDNIKGGVAYLNWLMGEFDGDPILVLAAYNAGEGSIRDAAGVPNFDETRAYVPKVLSAWTVARALCITPPELISDGCVFSVPGG